MNNNGKSRSWPELFWDALNSMKFAVILLILITLVSLVGVLLPQYTPNGFAGTLADLYLDKYGALLGGLFVFAGLQHIFSVWWYYLLLFLLCLNITVCSFRRLGTIISLVRREDYLDQPEKFRSQSQNRTISLDLPLKEVAEGAAAVLARSGYRVRISPESGDQATLLYAKRGALSQFGPFFTHISIVMVIIGAAISYMLSFEHFQWMAPGETIEVPNLSYMARPEYQLQVLGQRLSGVFGIDRKPSALLIEDGLVRDSDWRQLPGDLSLGRKMRVRLEKFEALFTPQGKPKAYLSSVTILDPQGGEEPLLSHLIKVNDPLIYGGVYFYQSSYSPGGGAPEWVGLTVAAKDSLDPQSYTLKLKPGGAADALGATGDSVRVENFVGNFRLDSEGKVSSQSGEDRNPAVKVIITRGTEVLSNGWVFKNFPDFSHQKNDQYSTVMGDYGKSYLTGLTIRTHRSQNLIWFGFALMVAGVLLSFYVNHRQFWLLVKPREGGSRVHLAGSSYKWKQPFVSEFKTVGDKIAGLSAH
ncbi:MAG: hypothetical protein A3F83_10995 [Candidatus Glassbacteria bacterium RIFCSPLOWO2_12_FULL_58_11]|uniref:ResB-like domain-containing protein n=1 Tax=Candidatus Glassbacteria bacterium RIFCSPLOWO2_12_FULL_58_11 TaxID=1817867 RepID=A0A1F5YNA3_9BACT|nr:MAG: hypothetical protein A3F83_10995 [Candidatus Glassbacteria bacterium RIFCSPLOWO2_12_FULL_58_11]